MLPENVAHGSEIQLQVKSGASWVSIAELSEVDYDADESLEQLSTLGTRILGSRRGNFKVTGTIKGYWLNGVLRAMFLGVPSPTAAGNSSSLYQSQAPFTRYQIQLVPSSYYGGTVAPPGLTLVNVTLGKDAVKWTAEKFTSEDITFNAEEVYGQ